MKSAKRKTSKPILPPIGHLKAEIAMDEVDNPMFSRDHKVSQTNPLKVRAYRNNREWSLGPLIAKGVVSDAQVLAAMKLCQLWQMAGTSVRAMDYSIDPVDGGGCSDPISERQMNALLELRNLVVSRGGRQAPLSKRHFDLLMKVVGEDTDIKVLGATRTERDVITAYVKHGLEDLAVYWGYQSAQRVA